MTSDKKFVSHYMLIQAEYSDEEHCRWLAEEMRSNRQVWIIEYFRSETNDLAANRLAIASELKKLSIPSITRIVDFFREGESVFIVTEIPNGNILKPMERFDEERFRTIGQNLLKVLILLQRNGIGLLRLSPEEIFVDGAGGVQLLIGEGWILSPPNESRQKELYFFGEVLLNLIVPIRNPKQEISREFVKANVPPRILPLFEEMLIDHTMQNLESASHYFQKKTDITSEPSLDVENAEQSFLQRSARYLILAGAAAAIFMVLTSRSDSLQYLSRFDVLRFQILGYLGSVEPQRILGEMYEKGYGVEKNMNCSVEWYRKAAQNGNVYAQMSLGHFYDKGIGLPADREQALYWFTLAATNGDKLAKKNVEILLKDSDEPRDMPVKISTVSESEEVPNPTAKIQAQESVTQLMRNEPKQTMPIRRYHTYWLHSGSSNNMQKTNQYGGIFGCYEEGLKNPVELVNFNHEVRSMAVDGEGNLYWADITTGQIMKSDPNGQDARVIVGRLFHPMGITIDKKRKLLFWSDRQQNEGGFSGGIGRSDLDGNDVKYIVVNGLVSGGKLKVDESEGKLFIPDIAGKKIVRVNEDGQNMIGIVFSVKPEGFDIDSEKRKLYWTDDLNSGIYESDYDGRNKRLVYTYYTTYENFETLMYSPLTQRIYFGKLGPASQSIGSTCIYNEMSSRPQEYVTNFKIHDIIRN